MMQEPIQIALPEALKEFVLKQAAEGGFSNPGEYIRELIRADQERRSQERLESLILEGIESGDPREMTSSDWDELKRRVWQRHADAQGQ